MDFDVSNIKLFAFDFDGTLMQSNHVKAQAFVDVVLHYSSGNSDAVEMVQSIKRQNPHFDRYSIFNALEQRFPDLKAATLAQAYGQQCEDIILKVTEVCGALVLLQKIKEKGYASIINSATPKKALERIVSQLTIKSYIASIYGAPKTKTENLQDAMLLYKLNSSQVLVIGDGLNDQEAAANTGCSFYGITNSYSDLNQEKQCLYTDLNVLVDALEASKTYKRANNV